MARRATRKKEGPQMDTYQELAKLIAEIESQMADRDTISEDIKAVYAEAKRAGYDPKTIRQVISKRRKDPEKIRQEQEKIEEYETALEVAGSNRSAAA